MQIGLLGFASQTLGNGFVPEEMKNDFTRTGFQSHDKYPLVNHWKSRL